MPEMKPHIIAFEGLLSYHAGFLRRGFCEPLALQSPNDFTYEVYSWFWGRPKIPTSASFILVAGHSFGGKRAIEFANELKKLYPNMTILVLTVDPRMKPPRSLLPTKNFYQTGRMHGFLVEGDEVENTELKGTKHTALPFRKEIRKAVYPLISNSVRIE